MLGVKLSRVWRRPACDTIPITGTNVVRFMNAFIVSSDYEYFCRKTIIFDGSIVYHTNAMPTAIIALQTNTEFWKTGHNYWEHNSGVIMRAMASQITGVSICLLNRLSRHRSKKTSKLCVTGLCAWHSLVIGKMFGVRTSEVKFPATESPLCALS